MTCTIEGCSRPTYARGWCNGHYQRWYKHGDLMPDVPLRARTSSVPADVMRNDPTDPRHGTENGYNNLHCHCQRCRAAWSAAVLQRRHADPARIQAHRDAQRRHYWQERQP